MSGFSADWLARREPYDTSARNPAVLDAVATSLNNISTIRIADLACGTGSMLRALAPRFAAKQNWRLVDNDLGLLARAIASAPPAGVTVNAVALDLSRDLEAALDGPLDVIVTSALLDLVSDAWLERLAVEIAARSLPIYAALSYDGRAEFRPADPLDGMVMAAVNAHQRTDKGFGPALGPTAAPIAIARFRSLGYSVLHGTSDWAIGTDDRDIQLYILAAWAGAACEMETSPSDTLGWLSRRRDFVAAGQSSIRIGHADFWARQIGTR
jgi:SAM-dependent methyltransferase